MPSRPQPGDAAAEQKFKALSEAYDVLKDEQKRAAYDRFGHAAFENGGRGGGTGDFGFATGFADIFDEMFGDFMGQRRRRARRRQPRQRSALQPRDRRSTRRSRAKQTTVRVTTLAPCEPCGGSGAGRRLAAGQLRDLPGQRTGPGAAGLLHHRAHLPACHGAGRVIDNPCRSCGGQGRDAQGEDARGRDPGRRRGRHPHPASPAKARRACAAAAAGDLYIFLAVKPHRIFQRDGANIHCRVPISMPTAALGGTIEVPVIDGGRAKLTVPAGTQSGHQFRLRSKGMSVLRSPARGDMYVEVVVETPVNLSKRQQELLREFEKAGDHGRTQPESEGFFAKVKEFFEDLRE